MNRIPLWSVMLLAWAVPASFLTVAGVLALGGGLLISTIIGCVAGIAMLVGASRGFPID